jgi:hypothetical protein
MDGASQGRTDDLLCPSARPTPDSVIFAVRTGADQDGVAYLDEPVPATADVLALAHPVDPMEVFRFGAPCAQSACVHFADARCTLGARVAEELPPVTDRLPACRLRARCRWFAEQGAEACRRCPLVITLRVAPTAEFAQVAVPDELRRRADGSEGTP